MGFILLIAMALNGAHAGDDVPPGRLNLCNLRATALSIQAERSMNLMERMARDPGVAAESPLIQWAATRSTEDHVSSPLIIDEIQYNEMSRERTSELREYLDYGHQIGTTADGYAILEGPVRRAATRSAEPFRQTRSDMFNSPENYPPEWMNTTVLTAHTGRILDMGTGDGAFVMDMRDSGIEAYGLDIRESPTWQGHDYFRRAPMQNSGFPDGHFDVIYTTSSIFSYPYAEHLPPHIAAMVESVTPTDLENALREMKRILHDRGLIRIYGVSNPQLVMSLCESIGGLRIRRTQSPDAVVMRWSTYRGEVPWIEIERTD